MSNSDSKNPSTTPDPSHRLGRDPARCGDFPRRGKPIVLLAVIFFAIRALSFFVRVSPAIQGIIVAAVLVTFLIAFFKNPRLAWQLLLAEILLDGSGHFFELNGIALRTLLLAVALGLWYTCRQKETKQILSTIPRGITRALTVLFGVVAFASLWGYSHGHSLHSILPYAIPYAFFLLLIPAVAFANDKENQTFFRSVLTATLIGSAIFSLFTFVIFSTHLTALQDQYYHWFRDVASGKITDVGDNFFRIVLPEHLLIPLIMIVLASLLMRKHQTPQRGVSTGWWVLLVSGSLILVLNLSRTYFLAFAIGLLILYSKSQWQQWLRVSFVSSVLILALFTAIHLAASGGAALGSELLGLRFGSIAHPTEEVSAYTRQALLPPIFRLIIQHPVIGSGLGSTITFYNPVTNNVVTTNQFDWGYLQIWTELGIMGIVSWLALVIATNRWLMTPPSGEKNTARLAGLHASLVALLFMTITTPALFHVFGILFLVFLILNVIPPLATARQRGPAQGGIGEA